tara:strand:+ start:64 stop:453 length:390 start_codon:yes stop_codon:yes gene_type:complete
MKIATIIARGLLGLVFVVFGLNGFLGFIETPPLAEQAGAFMGIIYTSGYLYVVKVLEITGGGLMLASIGLNRFAPLALTILAPIVVNIFLFHAFLDAPSSVGMSVVLLALCGFLAYAYKDNFAGLFAEH